MAISEAKQLVILEIFGGGLHAYTGAELEGAAHGHRGAEQDHPQRSLTRPVLNILPGVRLPSRRSNGGGSPRPTAFGVRGRCRQPTRAAAITPFPVTVM